MTLIGRLQPDEATCDDCNVAGCFQDLRGMGQKGYVFLDNKEVFHGYARDCQDRGQRTRDQVDGTSNGCERAMDWGVQERWRSMRGYTRPKSAVNISRLLALCDNHLEHGAVALALLDAQALRQQPKIRHQSAYSHRSPDSEQLRPGVWHAAG